MSYTLLVQTLAEGLETAFNIPEEDIAAILPEKEEDFKADEFKQKFLELDKERIQAINQKGKDKFDQGYSKAKKEVLSDYENQIRTSFGIDDEELKGVDLVNKVVEINSKKAKGDISKLTEEEIKSLPAVISLLNQKEKSWKEEKETLENDYNTKIKTFQRNEVIGRVSKKGLSILDSMNPILSENPVVKQNQLKRFTDAIAELDYQEEGDSFIPLVDGKRKENAHGHGVSFEQFVKDIATQNFDFNKSEKRDNPNPGGDGGSGGGVPQFKSEQEYVKFMSNSENSLEDKQKAREEWNKAAS